MSFAVLAKPGGEDLTDDPFGTNKRTPLYDHPCPALGSKPRHVQGAIETVFHASLRLWIARWPNFTRRSDEDCRPWTESRGQL